MTAADRRLAGDPRWDGTPGRVEVWYATLTDHDSGTGVWIHHETVAPTAERSGEPYGHGWVTVFPQVGAAVTERFGPAPVEPWSGGGTWFDAAGARARHDRWSGRAGDIGWDLGFDDPSPPLWTFPRFAWRHHVLPGAQVVVAPSARVTGTVETPEGVLHLEGATGGVSHIYGHGNAGRWGWLHADLGDGDVAEVVTAVSTRPGLDRLPPTAFVRFRLGGRDWPRLPRPAVGVRTTLGLPTWTLQGTVGRRRLRMIVDQPPERCVSLEYVDPDGGTAVCTNSERADCEIVIERRQAGRWAPERLWRLDGTCHAEVGLRGPDAPDVTEARPDRRSS